MLTKTYFIAPVAKPRMTRSDKWKKRPAVMKYRAFCDEIRDNKVSVDSGCSIVFTVPMPPSWSKKKREAMIGQPHQQTPDLDNFIKALLDAIHKDDSHIHELSAKKIWGDRGRITITP